MVTLKFVLIVILSGAHFAEVHGQECTVTLGGGNVHGITLDTVNPNRKACAYLGIPFAAPPTGLLRFKAPQPAEPWGDVGFNATSPPNWCPQSLSAEIPGVTISEDCLQLNVFVPQGSFVPQNLPVMIWIHGGGFVSGSSVAYDQIKLLAQGDMILVVPHYRLGILGFLSTGDDISPGNYGLKDQQYAIRWVSENIGAFGGNQSQLTVFGESSGAASAIYQLITPLNKELIHGVIAQSGTALSMWALDTSPPQESAQFMAARLGCPIDSSVGIVECLRNTSWEAMVEEQDKYFEESYQNLFYPFATVTPVVEPDLSGAFILEEPVELLKNGDIPDIPVLLGGNKHEGSFLLAKVYLGNLEPKGLNENAEYLRDQLVPDLMKWFKVSEDEGNKAAAASMELAYLNRATNRSNWESILPGLVDLMSVALYKSSLQQTADILSRRNRSVYLYSFEHHSNNTLWSLLIPVPVPVPHGVPHGDELMYIFNFPVPFSEADQAFSEIMTDMWLNFGRFGNPTPSVDDRFDPWPKYDIVDESYMKLNVTPTAFPGYKASWRPNGFEWN